MTPIHECRERAKNYFSLRLFQKGTAAFNAHDLDGFAEILADDVVFKASGGIQGEGKAACAAFFGSWFTAFPDARCRSPGRSHRRRRGS